MSESESQSKNTASTTKNATPLEKTNIESAFGGGYTIVKTNSNGEQYSENITNFSLDVKAFIETDDPQDMVEMVVHPSAPNDRARRVVVSFAVFDDKRKFRKEVCVGRTTTFSGSQSDLNELREFVGRHDVPTREITAKLGLNLNSAGEAEFVTPNKSFDAQGEVARPDFVFNQDGHMVRKLWVVDDVDYQENDVREFIEKITQTRDTERFLPVLGWYYACVFAPHIRRSEKELPSVNVMADTKSGKSATLQMLSKAFGLEESLEIDSTRYVLLRQIAGSASVPLFYDEYKPSDIPEYKLNIFQNLVRNATRGISDGRGNKTGSDDMYQLVAPIVVAGEEEIQGPAEKRRFIQTQFRKSVTESGTETRKVWNKLAGRGRNKGIDPTQHAKFVHKHATGMTYHTFTKEGWWDDAIDFVDEFIENRGYTSISNLEKVALQMIRLGWQNMEHLAEEIGADLDELPTRDEWLEAMEYVAGQQGDDERASHVDELLEMMSDASRQGYLGEKDTYKVYDDNDLRIHLKDAYAEVSRYRKDHGLTDGDLLDDPMAYKKRMKDMVDEEESYILDTSKQCHELNRTIQIDGELAEEQIEGFNLSDWRIDGEW